MKTLRLLAFALIVLCLALLFASCGCSRSPSASADATTTTRPAVTDASTTASATEPPATTVPETTLSTEAEIVSCGDFVFGDATTLYLEVPNATASYALADAITISENAYMKIKATVQGSVVDYFDAFVPLEPGDNVFSLIVIAENPAHRTNYTAVIHRRPLYTVTFDSNGGTLVASQEVEERRTATEPTTSRIGYTFAGWDHNFEESIVENLTVTASWTPDADTPYVVEYYLESVAGTGYDKVLTEPKTGTTDAAVAAEQKSFEHFTYSATKSTPNGIVAPDGSLVLTMLYSRDRYVVTFNGNGGTLTEGAATQSVRYGAAAAIPAFARSGYDFAGWDSLAGCDAVEQPLSITAQWTVIDYAITYTMNGGTNNENNPATYT
ncbi:MAG: InlB B-repeat-containing protein, partial [Clostridia bacterium]|nr:InlB B-repeat-containing protein [Clostridia bacterium]